MEVILPYVITRTLHMETLQEELCNKAVVLTTPSIDFLFPSINTPPSWQSGQRMHVACHVCIHWVTTLSFSPNTSSLVMKHLVDIIFQLTKYIIKINMCDALYLSFCVCAGNYPPTVSDLQMEKLYSSCTGHLLVSQTHHDFSYLRPLAFTVPSHPSLIFRSFHGSR